MVLFESSHIIVFNLMGNFNCVMAWTMEHGRSEGIAEHICANEVIKQN